MSQFPGNPNPNPIPPTGPGAAGRGRRPQSVTLRDQSAGGDDLGSLMTPAQQSLSDALRVCYRLVQFTILVLIVVYLFSSFQTVNQGEKALRLAFGRIEGEDLAPGPQFALPTPVGELVKVNVGVRTIRLDDEFWPSVREELRGKSPQEMKNSGKGSLDPASDGSLITADGSLVLARFSVSYVREQIRDFAQNVLPEEEERLVRAAVRRGVVHATAAVTIDEFLKGVADPGRQGEFESVAVGARRMAQGFLNQLKSGIVIRELNMVTWTPPFELITKFETVQSSQSQAQKRVEEAQTERVRMLATTAGDGAEPLMAAINAYGAMLDKGEEAAAEAKLKEIDQMLVALRVTRPDGTTAEITGEAARALSSAREYRSSVVGRSESDARSFSAKREAYLANPSLLLTGDWIDAYTQFLKREQVEMVWLPPGTRTLTLDLNRDPVLARRAEVKRQTDEANRRNQEQIRKMEQERFQDAPVPTTARE